MKRALALIALLFVAAPVFAHCKSAQCKWPVPVGFKPDGPRWMGPVHGAPGVFWTNQQWCHFDARTAQRYGHCSNPDPTIYNCNTKTISFPGWDPDDPIQGIRIEPGTPGDQLCRSKGYL